jgi:hypothetical protein
MSFMPGGEREPEVSVSSGAEREAPKMAEDEGAGVAAPMSEEAAEALRFRVCDFRRTLPGRAWHICSSRVRPGQDSRERGRGAGAASGTGVGRVQGQGRGRGRSRY